MNQNEDENEIYFESQVKDFNEEDPSKDLENSQNEERNVNVNISKDACFTQKENNMENSLQIKAKKSRKYRTYTLEVKKQVINEVI